jgi:hypothetical protein
VTLIESGEPGRRSPVKILTSAELEKHFIEALKHPSHLLSELKDFFVVLKLLELRELSEHPGLAGAIEAINRYSPFK